MLDEFSSIVEYTAKTDVTSKVKQYSTFSFRLLSSCTAS